MIQGTIDSSPNRDDGRMGLREYQSRADRLLAAARAGDGRARLRLAAVGAGMAPGLRDARDAVARDAGFQTWAQLTRHARELDAVRERRSGPPDRGMDTVHIRCGTDIQAALSSVGFVGQFQLFTDPFCVGPVHHGSPEGLVEERAGFLARALALDPHRVLERQRREYQALENAARHARVVLWFEHGSDGQLALAYLLHRISGWSHHRQVELVAVDAVPGVQRFVGLEQLAPEVLGWLWGHRREVNRELLRLGRRAWRAICSASPKRLDLLSRRRTPALPMLGRALRRHLLELPDQHTGLGLSEQLAVQLVAERGPIAAGQVFSVLVHEREPLPYLADTLFWWLLQPLLRGEQPLLALCGDHHTRPWAEQMLTITSHGHAALSGHRNWLDSGPPRRWVGGVAVDGDRDSWCLNKATGRPVARPGHVH